MMYKSEQNLKTVTITGHTKLHFYIIMKMYNTNQKCLSEISVKIKFCNCLFYEVAFIP